MTIPIVRVDHGPHARAGRSLETGRVSVGPHRAAELPPLELDGALEVLVLMAGTKIRFDRAATRWVVRVSVAVT